MEDQFMQLVGNLGFPIAVAAYSLVVLNRSINRQTEVLNKMQAIIERMGEK
jgi:hypothetical protein